MVKPIFCAAEASKTNHATAPCREPAVTRRDDDDGAAAGLLALPAYVREICIMLSDQVKLLRCGVRGIELRRALAAIVQPSQPP
jgi:hypothetical protein